MQGFIYVGEISHQRLPPDYEKFSFTQLSVWENLSYFFLQMATQVDSESPVAWQGLAVLCDKQPDITTHEETITIYTRLKDFVKE